MKKVAVFGAHGNMGKRYCLILERLCGCEVVRIDILEYHHGIVELEGCDGFIIATPTNTHVELIKFLIPYKKPILCEKPITKSEVELKELYETYPDLDLSMINQYGFLDVKKNEGHTWYDYFKTGDDGVLWDCINIIGTARSSFAISNESLVWECEMNGKRLDLRDMDHAYCANITEWVNGWRNKYYILHAHDKIWGILNDQKS